MADQNQSTHRGNIIADTSIRQPVLITMVMLLIVVMGLLAYSRLPVNLFPDFSTGIITVRVVYPGAGPETMSEQVARPIEDEVSTIAGVDEVTSSSSESFTLVLLELASGVDEDQVLQEVRDRVDSIRSQLPAEVEDPVYQRFDPSQAPVLQLAITSRSGQDTLAVREIIEDEIIPQVQSIPGVGSATLSGGRERQVNVLLDLERMQALRIQPAQVSQAIAQANANLGLGDALVGEQEYNLRVPSVFSSTADIAAVGIPGTPYTIGDFATIEEGVAEQDAYTRLNGQDSLLLAVRKQSGTNTAAVAEEGLRAFEEAIAAHPDLQFVVISDQGEQVRENVNGAIEEIIIAVVLAMLVVLVFFRNLRNTIVTVIGLPIIILGTFALISLFGVDLNILSLLALSVSAGLVIDDAIVVRENIFRHLERGEAPMVAASRGASQVATSVLAMTLTIIAVFLPATFTGGVVGILFTAFGVTVSAAMVISLIEAFTFGPMISSRFLKQQEAKPHHVRPGEEHLPDEAHEELGRLERGYERITRWTLGRRWVTVALVVAVLAVGVVGSLGVKFSFIPDLNTPELAMSFEYPPGTPLDTTDARARQVEAILMEDPEVDAVQTTVGGDAGASHAEFFLKLHHDASSAEVLARLRERMAGESLPQLVFAQAGAGGAGTSTDVTQRPLLLEIRSAGSIDELAPVVDQVVAAVRDVPGFTDISTSYTPGNPELQYRLKQSVANDYGLTNQALAVTMRTLVDGNTAAVFRSGGEDYDIVVRLREEDRRAVDQLQGVRLPIGAEDVPIGAVAEIQVSESPTTIRRGARLTEVLVGGNNTGRVLTDVQADIQARIDALDLPPGVTVGFGGTTEQQSEGFAELGVALVLAVLFVYMVLAAQFESFSQPVVIMLAMPLSAVGAFLGLGLTGQNFSVLAFIGLLMLLGLVVKNSILMVDFTNNLRAAGMAKHDALQRASAVRLRPILMTSLAIVFGNLPAAIGIGEGAELRRGLATVIIGGVITSTLLTLVLIPTAYSLMDSLTDALGRLTRREWLPRRRPAPDAPEVAEGS